MKGISNFYKLIVFLALFFFISCQKEYSFEGGPQAQYTINGSPGNCFPALLSGFYIAGTPTGVGDTLQLTVHVTLPGNYTIYSIPNDGVSFTASGNFADTGTKVVTLQCSGTPVAEGTYIIQIPGDNGCSFSLTVLKKAPASYTLAGFPNDCDNPVLGGPFIAGKPLTSINTIALTVIIKLPGTYTITTDTIDGMSFSASGLFTGSGVQTVILSGNGVPENPGLIYYNVKADSSSCNFSVPVQNPEPLATYVLQSGVGASGLVCAPQSVEGIYTAGVSLYSGNTITISPYATLPGNYTISTKMINGIIFSASGNFPAPGAYLVALKGSGTPLTSGTFTFTPFIIGPSPIGGANCDVTLIVH